MALFSILRFHIEIAIFVSEKNSQTPWVSFLLLKMSSEGYEKSVIYIGPNAPRRSYLQKTEIFTKKWQSPKSLRFCQ